MISEDYHFITFSGADFANDRYDLHFAYRRGDGIGAYTPILAPIVFGREPDGTPTIELVDDPARAGLAR